MNSTPDASVAENRMVWRGKQVQAILDDTRELDIEGALGGWARVGGTEAAADFLSDGVLGVGHS